MAASTSSPIAILVFFEIINVSINGFIFIFFIFIFDENNDAGEDNDNIDVDGNNSKMA